MRFAGVDIASETHTVAMVDENGQTLLKPTAFAEDAAGYAKLMSLLGPPGDILIAVEATGHYWKNLFAALAAGGFPVGLINPLRTRRFAQEEFERTETDAIDALGIARFSAQKRPPATRLPDQATEELRELVRHRDRLVQRLIARGKPPKLALVACMRKLLTAVYSVAKNRRPFVPMLAPELTS